MKSLHFHQLHAIKKANTTIQFTLAEITETVSRLTRRQVNEPFILFSNVVLFRHIDQIDHWLCCDK